VIVQQGPRNGIEVSPSVRHDPFTLASKLLRKLVAALRLSTTTRSHNGLALHDGQGDALPALRDVTLIEVEWVVHRQEVGEHAREDAAVVACLNGGDGKSMTERARGKTVSAVIILFHRRTYNCSGGECPWRRGRAPTRPGSGAVPSSCPCARP